MPLSNVERSHLERIKQLAAEGGNTAQLHLNTMPRGNPDGYMLQETRVKLLQIFDEAEAVLDQPW